ncbi:hypothetical protein RRG08_031779 [Elysia crispata]|uniref:C-type lectin domain-containing protein n=1 Tax=Elysia crispata TaxID=231223 RepID=A0AAE1DUV5_9GAST|nr:hypothetical protein RRG08_031779 [Elysia crispata]
MPKAKAINDFLVQEMKSFDKPRPMWIGMHDKVIKDRALVWEDGSHVDSWGNFDWTKDGLLGGGEVCIALDPNLGKCHDYGCSSTGILSRLGVAKNTISFVNIPRKKMMEWRIEIVKILWVREIRIVSMI